MESREEGKSEKTFKNFGKKVDQFLVELNEAGDKLQKEFEEKFEELKQTAEKLKKEADSNERWKEVENNLKKAADELSNAFKAAFKKRTP
jgi:sugar-specific transcriptional regulator TrmB